MSWRRKGSIAIGLGTLVCAACWQLAAPAPAQQAVQARGRFEFQVIESFDAHYLGDTPGHIGRGGGLGGKPDVALGDPVYHDAHRIGKVTNLRWDRTKESLEVEFDPEPFRFDAAGKPVAVNRVAVGQDVWIPLGGAAAGERKGE